MSSSNKTKNVIDRREFFNKLFGGLKSEQLIPVSFLMAIILGTLLLMLPAATVEGEETSLVTALFTATTSLCVTGLVVVDTYAHWTLFGKIIILILIQLGGFGIISVYSFMLMTIRKKISYKGMIMIHDTYGMDTLSGVMRFLEKVFIGTFIVETLGMILYIPAFIPRFGVGKGIWVAAFTSISAFCNAGIDIMGPDSLISYSGNYYVLIVTMMLIILGGMGYVVWFDIFRGLRKGIKKRYSPIIIIKHLGEHTKLVISLTLILIVSGAIVTFIAEYNNPDTIGDMTLGGKIWNSIFQSVTYRTAGFASVPQDGLTPGSCVLGLLLMFIGGSPVGTAGGVKTVTFFIVCLNATAFIRNRNESTVFGKKMSHDMIRKASAIVFVSFGVTFVLLIILLITNDVSLIDGAFEVFSATATVGLSRALTPALNTAGRLIIIVSMYLGRIGPISMALFFMSRASDKNRVSFAEGRYYVG